MGSNCCYVIKCKRLGIVLAVFTLAVVLSLFMVQSPFQMVVSFDQKANYVDMLPRDSLDLTTQQTSQQTIQAETRKDRTQTEATTCYKQYNVAFLKVHKAGSTTIMNIFLRFAISNNLNIALPRNSSGYGFNYLGYGKTLKKSNIVPLPANETYSILCNHVIYSKESFDMVMPPGTTYVGIVREPKSHFISASVYYGFAKHLKKYYKMPNASISDVLNKFLIESSQFSRLPMFYVHNRQSFDFGLSQKKFEDLYAVENYIRKLDLEFKFVMLMEYFDESLVMLKRFLCWSLKEILYVPLNVNRKNKEKVTLSQTAEDYLFKFNYADFRLYDYFKVRFMQKMKHFGKDLEEEVVMFKEIRKRVSDYCFSPLQEGLTIPASKWSETFVVTKQDCYEMTMHELPMLRRLINVANDRYNDWRNLQNKVHNV